MGARELAAPGLSSGTDRSGARLRDPPPEAGAPDRRNIHPVLAGRSSLLVAVLPCFTGEVPTQELYAMMDRWGEGGGGGWGAWVFMAIMMVMFPSTCQDNRSSTRACSTFELELVLTKMTL